MIDHLLRDLFIHRSSLKLIGMLVDRLNRTRLDDWTIVRVKVHNMMGINKETHKGYIDPQTPRCQSLEALVTSSA